MKQWIDRPFEIKYLLNPAFCGVVILRALQGYEAEDKLGMPFSLSFFVLPFCLHDDSRKVLLQKSRSYFLKIVNDNPQMLIGFAERTKNLLPYTFEGLGLAMHYQSLSVTDSGRLRVNEGGISNQIKGTQECIDSQRTAKLLGKKLAEVRDRVTIYTTLGVKP